MVLNARNEGVNKDVITLRRDSARLLFLSLLYILGGLVFIYLRQWYKCKRAAR